MAGPAQQDRKAGFLRLFTDYGAALDRLAGAYALQREDREDLLQEIAAALWQALPNFRGESSERTWLYRIAHNVAITAAVKLRRRSGREFAPDDPPQVRAPGATAEQDLIAAEKRRALLSAIRELPAADRQITILHLEGLSALEIAGITGLAAGAVATRMTRIREKLRRAIGAQEMPNAR